MRVSTNRPPPQWFSGGDSRSAATWITLTRLLERSCTAAAESMRRLLVERARRKRRMRHGGGRSRIDLENLDVAAERGADDLLALDEALQQLSAEEPTAAEVVKLRYFAGLTAEARTRSENRPIA